jgi:hypothetical protein
MNLHLRPSVLIDRVDKAAALALVFDFSTADEPVLRHLARGGDMTASLPRAIADSPA